MRQLKKELDIILKPVNRLKAKGKSLNLVKKRKHHFSIKKNRCFLLCFLTFSNIYLCLLDCNHKSIITKTAGNVKVSSRNSKKEKKALHNVYKIVEGLRPYIGLYSIKYVALEFRGSISLPFLKVLKDNLEGIGVKIISFRLILTTPHNGMRIKGQRRV